MKKLPRKTNSSRRPHERTKGAPRTTAQYDAKPEKFKAVWDRVVTVISKMRSGKTSLQQVAKEQGISPRTVKRWAGSALQKQASGKWTAKKNDRLLRVLKMPTPEGLRAVAIRGSRQATKLATYSNAVQKYLQTGNTSDLLKFQGKYVKDADGVEHLLITDRKELNRLGASGVLSFETLYAHNG